MSIVHCAVNIANWMRFVKSTRVYRLRTQLLWSLMPSFAELVSRVAVTWDADTLEIVSAALEQLQKTQVLSKQGGRDVRSRVTGSYTVHVPKDPRTGKFITSDALSEKERGRRLRRAEYEDGH